jgi:uncharacterized damage-inducible protein DinB
MQAIDVLNDAFGRIRSLVPRIVADLDADALTWRPDPEANTIAWLIWHLTRIQDDHVAALAGREQTWSAGGWAERFGLPAGSMDTGYGQSRDQVAAVRPADAQVLVDYHEAVAEETVRTLAAMDDEDLDRVVDTSWDPPVTAGVRLVSVIGDDLQHAGQAAYLRGLWARRSQSSQKA